MFDRSPNVKYAPFWFLGQLYTHSFEGRTQTFLLHWGFIISAVAVKMKEQWRRTRTRRVTVALLNRFDLAAGLADVLRYFMAEAALAGS